MNSSESRSTEAALESCWTAVGNIIRERPYGPGGAEIRFGTKHFAPGAKVYIINWYAGMCERIIVAGMHRKSKHLITITIDVRLVENLRSKVYYNPGAITKFKRTSLSRNKVPGPTRSSKERLRSRNLQIDSFLATKL